MLFRSGWHEFRQASHAFITPELIAAFPATAVGENAHNNFLQILAGLGVTGLAAFLWLLAAAGRSLRGARAAAAAGQPAQLALAGGVLAFLISCLGGHPFLITEVMWMFMLALGTMTGMGETPPAGVPRSPASLPAVLAVLVVLSAPVRVWQVRHDDTLRTAVGVGPITTVEIGRAHV